MDFEKSIKDHIGLLRSSPAVPSTIGNAVKRLWANPIWKP